MVREGGVDQPARSLAVPRASVGFHTMMRNITLTGGAAPARAYIEELMPDVLEGKVDPGRVFDRTVSGSTRSRPATRRWTTRTLKVLIRP